MKLKDYISCRNTWGSKKIPRSAQQSIPVDRIYEDGIWQSGDVFSIMWSISDINYTAQSDAEKQRIQNENGAIYDTLPMNFWAKFCIISQRMDEEMLRRVILFHREDDNLNELRKELNHHVMDYVWKMGNVIPIWSRPPSSRPPFCRRWKSRSACRWSGIPPASNPWRRCICWKARCRSICPT